MRVRAGTSGYSYKAWKGSFYPEDLPQSGMLAYYASRLPAVEINQTFYRMPRRSVLETWAASVPDGFRFALKASRRITHFKRLADVDDETAHLVETASALADRAGVILYQLPPNFKRDDARLTDFVDRLPNPGRSAFEFRHPSWFDPAVYAILGERNCALCLAETDEERPPVIATADWTYLRLRKSAYADAELEAWAAVVGDSSWKEVWTFFKHEDAGVGPQLAERFLALTAS